MCFSHKSSPGRPPDTRKTFSAGNRADRHKPAIGFAGNPLALRPESWYNMADITTAIKTEKAENSMENRNKPVIRKHGTIKFGTVESTPVVFRGNLYRFEYCRPAQSEALAARNPDNPNPWSSFHFIDLRTGRRTPSFARDHHLGCAFTDGGVMYAVGVDVTWGGDTLHIFSSTDLEAWDRIGELRLPGWKIFNTGVCRSDGGYTLLMEISEPVEEAGTHPFTFRFARSSDMIHWTLTPRDCVFQKDRYAGGPAIYTVGDGWYYVLYLEAGPGPTYTNCIARSRDLKSWEYSPLNPVLMYDPAEDKQIANPFLTEEEQKQIRDAEDINNSDLELCEFNGRTILYYSWGNQRGTEFLAEASFEGSMKAFLEAWF